MKQKFKTSEVAKFFYVRSATVVNWINDGKLPAYETIGGHYRILQEDLLSFMKKKEIPIPDELKTPEELRFFKYRILIVDDEKNVIESVKLMLENMGVDVEIETAFNGIEAGIKLIQFSPHLVILDAIMPDADGDIVCKEIKNNKELRNIKILVFTGYPKEGQKLLELGADKFIEKFSKDSDVDNFQKEVCKLLNVKYRKVLSKVK